MFDFDRSAKYSSTADFHKLAFVSFFMLILVKSGFKKKKFFFFWEPKPEQRETAVSVRVSTKNRGFGFGFKTAPSLLFSKYF